MSRRGGEGRREAILPVTCQVDVLQRRGCVHRIGERRDAEVTKRVARERQHLQLSQAMAFLNINEDTLRGNEFNESGSEKEPQA